MTQTIRLAARDGHVLEAFLAEPVAAPRGAVLVIQEVFGITRYIRQVCEDYAADGYLALAPALYDRQRPGSVFEAPDEAGLALAKRMREALRWPEVIADVDAAVACGRRAGKVGIVGFCVGGSVAWLAAQHSSVHAASCYYGRDIVQLLAPAPRCPTQLHYAEHDHLIPPADVEIVRRARPEVELYRYDAQHGFDNFTRPVRHDGHAATARERTLALFRRCIG